MIAPVHSSIRISNDSPEVLRLELSFSFRPTRRLDLLGQVPTLEPFRALPLTARLWLRWAQPEGAGLEQGHLEVGRASDRDAPAHTAQVIARAEVTDPWGSWALFRVAQIQGVIDLLLAGADAPVGVPSPYLHLIASVDPGVPHRRAQSSSPPAQTSLAA